MKVRGIALLAAKSIVVRRGGAEAWSQLYGEVARSHPCFRTFITSDSRVPLLAHLALHDELVRRFCLQDKDPHIQVGRESARWALTEGPCKTFFDRRDLGAFVESLPKLWTLCFADTTSRSEVALGSEAVEFRVFDLPQWHPFLEYFVMGFHAELLESFCANPIGITCLKGGRGPDYHYLLQATPTSADGDLSTSVAASTPVAAPPLARPLSEREVEVLLLVATGKTNEEIGGALGLSPRTAQHHVARAYRKIGASNRATAVLWLAKQGMIGR